MLCRSIATFALAFPVFVIADWPAYRADASRSGYTTESIPNQLTLRWVHRAQHAPRPAWPTSDRIDFDLAFQPIIMGDLIIFGSSVDDQVRAIDAATGELRWRFFTGGPVRFAPFGWKDRIFVASDDGFLYALGLDSGEEIWKFRAGPTDEMVLGNERMISKWPARGGPVVRDDVVYLSAGIWPSDGVHLHALDAETGKPVWSNRETGRIFMAQPHGGAHAESGVSAQGYLVATDQQLLVPTGRAVPAGFDRTSGELLYYHLQKNQQRGGTRAMAADRFLVNAGCLFDLETGDLASQIGYGPLVGAGETLLQANSRSLKASKWITAKIVDRKGEAQETRQLQESRLVSMENEILDFIVAGSDAICGEDGRVSVVDWSRQRTTWWSHEVEGKALGLAAANGRLVVSTDQGVIYCFDGEPADTGHDPVKVANWQAGGNAEVAEEAKEILEKAEVRDGFAVVLDAERGDLAIELAKQSNLHVYAVESDPDKVAHARNRLADSGVYGNRVTVHQGDPENVAYPKYFANLVVSSNPSPSEKLRAEMKRLQRPFGGKIFVDGQVEERGPLEGGGNWTHQNSNAANTLCSDDATIKGPLSMFWFRDIDFEIPNRHGQGPAPLVHNGRMVVGGVDGVACLDAYNGRTLWIHNIEGHLRDYDGIHHDVGVGEAGGPFCLSDDAVFVRYADRCLRINLATGEREAEFPTPAAADAEEPNRNWGFLAYHDGLLFGSTLNDAHRVSPRYKLTELRTESTSLFAMNAKTGELKWRFQPEGSIRNNAIAISGKRVFAIDRPVIEADHIADPKRGGRQGDKLAAEEIPSGTLIAFDAQTGDELWRKDDDIFGTQLAASEAHQTLLMNYQAVRHKFFHIPSETGGRLAGFDLATGERKWDQRADYQTRPVINDYKIYAHGGAWNLITGEPIDWEFERSYGCGQISSSKHLMLYRSATLGYPIHVDGLHILPCT
ncbi:MAG: PQQ-binding-like beta-propeller repeat protein, partial [Verrucomicrobiota bacterium]